MTSDIVASSLTHINSKKIVFKGFYHRNSEFVAARARIKKGLQFFVVFEVLDFHLFKINCGQSREGYLKEETNRKKNMITSRITGQGRDSYKIEKTCGIVKAAFEEPNSNVYSSEIKGPHHRTRIRSEHSLAKQRRPHWLASWFLWMAASQTSWGENFTSENE
jgi:hypothetical protein